MMPFLKLYYKQASISPFDGNYMRKVYTFNAMNLNVDFFFLVLLATQVLDYNLKFME